MHAWVAAVKIAVAIKSQRSLADDTRISRASQSRAMTMTYPNPLVMARRSHRSGIGAMPFCSRIMLTKRVNK